jgi:hypothetical protein
MAISEGGLRSNIIERRGLISLGLASLSTPLFACASRAEPESGSDALAPVGQPGDLSDLREPGAPPEAGIGLCLSGGGYRAMLFHVGGLWRLYESGMLKQGSEYQASPAGRSRRACSASNGHVFRMIRRWADRLSCRRWSNRSAVSPITL